jgi:hypothetical protein
VKQRGGALGAQLGGVRSSVVDYVTYNDKFFEATYNKSTRCSMSICFNKYDKHTRL